MKAIVTLILILLINWSFYAQVKIGDNPASIHLSSILELESSNKVLVISRMTNTQMNAIQPLKGALVYNTSENCVFVYNGALWKSLCNGGTDVGIDTSIKVTTANIAPTDNNIGDFWINDSLNNAVSIFDDNNNWTSLDNNPIRGNGVPDITTVPNPISGDLYIDSTTGAIYAYNGTDWIPANPKANNGLTIDATNNIQLGGVLIKPTLIETSAAFTLGITGLENGDTSLDDIVTVNKITGQLKKVTAANFLREEVTHRMATTDGQVQFTPNIIITDVKKVNVYRNGVRIDFTVVNSTTIEIEPEAACYSGDQIRIVQFY